MSLRAVARSPWPDRIPRGSGSRRRGAPKPARHNAREPRLVSAGRTGTGRRPIDNTATHLRFAIIGAGRLGTSLGIALREAGARLVGYTAGSAEGRARADAWLGGTAVDRLSALVEAGPDLYMITVPDQVLHDVAADLGRLLPAGPRRDLRRHAGSLLAHGPFVAHTSGATSVAALGPCSRAGAQTLVFHPLQTFSDPAGGSGRFAGAAVAVTPQGPVEGSHALALGLALAEALRSRPFYLPDDKRALYHAAATVACNYLVTIEHHAEMLFVEAGLPDDEALALFLPLVRATLDNLADRGTVASLTGPLSRGDAGTIARHMEALADSAPHITPLYQVLGLATLDIVRARNELDPTVIAHLQHLLSVPACGTPDLPPI